MIVTNGQSFNEVLYESSGDVDFILMGMITRDENFTGYYENMQKRLQDLPTTAPVLAAKKLPTETY